VTAEPDPVTDGQPPDPAYTAVRDLPTYWRELGRLRMGDREPLLRNGRPVLKDGRPVLKIIKLPRWRLTSQDEKRIQLAARLWGGTPEPWERAPEGDQWQVTTNVAWVPVRVPPEAALTQKYELWTGPTGAARRCDGEFDEISGAECLCRDEQEADQSGETARACKLTTRLSVVLEDLPGIGVWRLETHGFWSGTGLVTFAKRMLPYLAPYTPLQLRIERKRRPVVVNGERRLFEFPVAVIDSDKTMGELLATGRAIAPPPGPVAAIAARAHAAAGGPPPGAAGGAPPGEPADGPPGPSGPTDDGDAWYHGGPVPPHHGDDDVPEPDGWAGAPDAADHRDPPTDAPAPTRPAPGRPERAAPDDARRPR